jgi:hypothetical protein
MQTSSDEALTDERNVEQRLLRGEECTLYIVLSVFVFCIQSVSLCANYDCVCAPQYVTVCLGSSQVTKRLGGENYVFWGGREGYQTLLTTDLKKELDRMVRISCYVYIYFCF